MVPVLRATDSFHARVVAARLGSEGILTSFRGPVDGPYPMGTVEVLVERGELEAARELLLADEVESAFAEDDDADEDDGEVVHGRRRGSGYGPWIMVVAALLLLTPTLVAVLD
jgi:Putative prokaryotic signal transducing protein